LQVQADGTELTIYIVAQCFLAAGFFAVVNVSYILFTKWYLQANEFFSRDSNGEFTQLLSRGSRLLLLAGVALGVTGGVLANPTNGPSSVTLGTHLSTAAKVIFFVLTAALLLMCLYAYFYMGRQEKPDKTESLQKDVALLALIAAILNIRTAFNLATIKKPDLMFNEHYFYPLSVLPELIVLIVYCIPHVVSRFKYTDNNPV